MKTLIGVAFALTLLCALPAGAQQQRGVGLSASNQERRVALVIGNSAYETAPLKNPANDARDMAQALKGLGFEVMHKENLGLKEMKGAIREFGAKIRGGGIGLFYYAGHGVQVKGVNYLVPVDAKVQSEQEMEFEAVDAGFVLAQMDGAGNAMNIMVLDACRNNPFARSFRSASRGLAQMDAPSGTLIAYATAPGSVASDGNERNGLYTQELLKFVQLPNLNIEDVFKRVRISVRNLTQGRQTPWESSSLTGDFFFAGTNKERVAALPTQSLDPAAVELAYWESIKDSRDPEDFKAYLQKYPDGQFASLARRRAVAPADAAALSRIIDPQSLSAPPSSRQKLSISAVNCMCMQLKTLKVASSVIISGMGWDGGSEVKVSINGKDVSSLIDSQKEYIVSVQGSLSELNLRDGRNEVVITVNGVSTEPYVFRQAIK